MRLMVTVICIFLLVGAGGAQWPADPAQNLPISVGAGDRNLPAVVGSSDGYYVMVWEDERSGDSDIYAQKLDKAGYVLWTAGGIAVCNAPQTQRYPELAADDNGGVIIVWEDFRSGAQDIYAQRLNGEGQPQWTANGIAISTAQYQQTYPQIAPDGYGGAYIVWDSKQNGTVFPDIYAQRVNPDGSVAWSTNGNVVSAAPYSQREPQIFAAPNATAYVVWQDSRADFDYPDIYAQKIDYNGTMQWTADGAAVCVAGGEQEDPLPAADGNGNLFVAWKDRRSGTDIYAQRMNPDGSPGWGTTGTAVCTALNSQYSPHIIADGNSGCYITWHDFRNSASSPFDIDVYMQRMDFSGTALWQTDGVRVSTSQDNQIDEVVMSDGDGGALVCWREHPYNGGGETDLYIQKIDSSGARLWTDTGVAVCTATRSQRKQVMCPDGHGGAFIAWADERDYSVNDADIYAGYVNFSGSYTNAGPGLKINELYYCGPVNNMFFFFDQYIELTNTSDTTVYLDGVIVSRVRNPQNYVISPYFEAVYAFQFPGVPGGSDYPLLPGDYVVLAQDAYDHSSTVANAVNLENAHWEFYNQLGADWDNPDVPNLLNINTQRTNDFLINLSSDWIFISSGAEYTQVGEYVRIPFHNVIDGVEYHSDTSAVKEEYFIVDMGFAGGGIARYSGKSTQRIQNDKDTNHSLHDFETLAAPTPELPVNSIQTPAHLAGNFLLAQNYPNPFNPVTTIRFQLPKSARVSLVIYNPLGEKIRELKNETLPAGEHQLRWNGRDAAGQPVASGIYICRLETADRQLTRKMILLR